MMQTIDRPNLLSDFPVREITPTGWITEKEAKSPFQIAGENFVQWNRAFADFEKLASQHFYQNPNFTELDIRQHRAALHQLIAQGEMIAAHFLSLKAPAQSESYITFIDQQIRRLSDVLQEWHGNPMERSDIPDSFKEAMQEFAEGKTVEMEADMFGQNAETEAHISS